MDKRPRRLLKDTILVGEAYVAYCHIVYAAELLFGDRWDDGTRHEIELKNMQYGYRLLASFIDL